MTDCELMMDIVICDYSRYNVHIKMLKDILHHQVKERVDAVINKSVKILRGNLYAHNNTFLLS